MVMHPTEGLGEAVAEFVAELNRLNKIASQLIEADLDHSNVEARVSGLVGVLTEANIINAEEAEEYARRSFKEK